MNKRTKISKKELRRIGQDKIIDRKGIYIMVASGLVLLSSVLCSNLCVLLKFNSELSVIIGGITVVFMFLSVNLILKVVFSLAKLKYKE